MGTFSPITGDIIIVKKNNRLFFNKEESFVVIKVKGQIFAVQRTNKGFLLGLFYTTYYLNNYNVEIYRANYELSRGIVAKNLFNNLGSFEYMPKRSFKEFISDIFDIDNLNVKTSNKFKKVY
jgi:hypothetical protein